jgi:predicted DNA-binding transcriptional regulator AlpA
VEPDADQPRASLKAAAPAHRAGDDVLLGEPLLLDIHGVVKLTCVSRSTWLRLLATDRVPRPVRLGRRVLWKRDELVSWIDAGCPQPRERWEAVRRSRGTR